MRVVRQTCLAFACFLLPLLWDAQAHMQGTCEPVGDVRFVCMSERTEDIVSVPNSDWVLTSGVLRATHTRTGVKMPLYSTEARPDRHVFGACPGPLAEAEPQEKLFRVGGLSLRAGTNGIHRLYALHRVSRASVEVFELDARGNTPSIVWIGCVIYPSGIGFNSVTSLPGNGIVGTNFNGTGVAFIGMSPEAVKGRARLVSGQPTGELWEWGPSIGWKKVPDSEASGPNGVEASPDGAWLYFNEWAKKRVVRISRGRTPIRRDYIQLSFHPDNLHWQRDGFLMTAGQGPTAEEVLGPCLAPKQNCITVSMGVARIDPKALKAEEVLRYPAGNGIVGAAAAAADLGSEIWVTDIGPGNRIVRFARRQTP